MTDIEDIVGRLARVLVIGAVAGAVAGLLAGCATGKQVREERVARDSVVVIYRTVLRDSVRLRDSVVVREKVKLRDSVVMRVDAMTGAVVGRDSWHWTETNNDKREVKEQEKRAFGTDSVASVATKRDERVVVTEKGKEGGTAENTHYWRTLLMGMVTGIVVLAGVWRGRS